MTTLSTLSKSALFIFFPLPTTTLSEASSMESLAEIKTSASISQPLYGTYIEKSDELLLRVGQTMGEDSASRKVKILLDFSNTLVQSSQDLDPAIVQMVNDNFWDLM